MVAEPVRDQAPGQAAQEFTHCPACGQLAEVQWRAVVESTDGPVEHAKIACVSRHWFLLPVAALSRPAP